MAVEIGGAVRRAGRVEAKWHLVESVVAGAAITRCGRRMEPWSWTSLQSAEGEAASLFLEGPSACQRCASPDAIAVSA